MGSRLGLGFQQSEFGAKASLPTDESRSMACRFVSCSLVILMLMMSCVRFGCGIWRKLHMRMTEAQKTMPVVVGRPKRLRGEGRRAASSSSSSSSYSSPSSSAAAVAVRSVAKTRGAECTEG